MTSQPPVSESVDPRAGGWGRGLLTLGLVMLSALLATVPMDLGAEAIVCYSLVATMLVLWPYPHRPFPRLLFLSTAVFIGVRYVMWRTTTTIVWHDLPSFIGAILLYAAELYSLMILLLSFFTTVQPAGRTPVTLAGPPETWPTVDVLIPTYDEPVELLETTLIAATQLQYPASRYTVYLCDDGGTDQRCQSADPALAAAARERQAELRALCERVGAVYLTRARNERAKAGNLNAALAQTHGELVAVLDADHIPTVDFLSRLVGYFQRDERLFLAQSPHFFVNADPFEKNLDVHRQLPSENEMFYGVIQKGLDFWDSAMFCGSAALLRRRCLEQVGGLSGVSITEDAETSLDLHAQGYRSVYLNEPLISGLQPETYAGFVTQRVRWAQGMVQILLLKNPLWQKGLNLAQRLCYFATASYWLFGYARLVYLLAPAAFLLFGLRIYETTIAAYAAIALPFLLANLLASSFLFGAVRWPFISAVYELLQAFYSLPGILRVLWRPRTPEFAVTPKGQHYDKTYLSSLSGPFKLVYLITMLALAVGIWRWFAFPDDRTITGITMSWAIFNVLLLNAAIGVLFEQQQRRTVPRIALDLMVKLVPDGGEPLVVHLQDLSVGGAFVVASLEDPARLAADTQATLRVFNQALGEYGDLHVVVQNSRLLGPGKVGIGLRFVQDHLADKRFIVALVHGDSGRWQRLRASLLYRPGLVASFRLLLTLSTRNKWSQLKTLFGAPIARLVGNSRSAQQTERTPVALEKTS